MGSLDSALLTGFICRLCSRMNKIVYHIYGDEGNRLRLSAKINTYLPINVSMHDSFPKTICPKCIEKLQLQHKLVSQIKRAHKKFTKASARMHEAC